MMTLFESPSIAAGWLLIACCASLPARSARAGGVKTVDDRIVAGDITAFDGTTLTLQTKNDANAAEEKKFSLEDTVEVRFANGSPTSEPSTQPISDASSTTPQPAPAQAAAPSLLSKAMSALGLASNSNESPAAAQPRRTASPVAANTVTPAPTTQQTPLSNIWQIKLLDGDLLHGTVRAFADDTVSIKLANSEIELKIPTNRISELWHGSAEQIRRARGLKPDEESGAKDVAYVLKDADFVSVRGIAIGIDSSGKELSFQFEGKERKIGIAKLLGLSLISQKASPADAKFHQQLRLQSGDLIGGRWTGLKDGNAVLSTSWNQTLTIPVRSISTIGMRNGRVVYLSDFEPTRVEQTPYFDRIIAWRKDTSLNGGPIVLSDGTYTRGIAMHSRCLLEYDLGGKYQRFTARVGFEQPAGRLGRAAVSVAADDKLLYDNSDARGTDAPHDLNLDITNVQKLTLLVDFGAEEDTADRVIFANARLVRGEVEQ